MELKSQESMDGQQSALQMIQAEGSCFVALGSFLETFCGPAITFSCFSAREIPAGSVLFVFSCQLPGINVVGFNWLQINFNIELPTSCLLDVVADGRTN